MMVSCGREARVSEWYEVVKVRWAFRRIEERAEFSPLIVEAKGGARMSGEGAKPEHPGGDRR